MWRYCSVGNSLDSSWLVDYWFQLWISEVGKLVVIGDGIVCIEGLFLVVMDEILCFEDGSEVLVFDLGSKCIGVILFNQYYGLVVGSFVQLIGCCFDIGVGDGFFGCVVDLLGWLFDGGLFIEFSW